VNFPSLLTVIVALGATILLVGGWLRPDLVAIMVLVVLGVTRLVTPEQALAGFSGSAVITILAISIIAEGLQQTGITYWLGQQMKRLAGQNEKRQLIAVILSGATLSLFMNNIAAMAVLLPATMSLARQVRTSPSRFLMPLAFGVIAGGMATLFTTSNIIISSELRDAGFTPFGVLDFLPVGLLLVLLVVLYMVLVGRHLLPERNPAGQAARFHQLRQELLNTYSLAASLWEVTILPGSSMAGQSIRDGQWRNKTRLNIIGIARNGTIISAPQSNEVIREGDVVIGQGEPATGILADYGLRLEHDNPEPSRTASGEATLAEIVLAPHSNLTGKTLREIHFREKFNLTVLALWRSGKPVHIGFANLPLRVGDGLLVQGAAANLKMLFQERDFYILEEDPEAIMRPQKGLLATFIGLITLAVAITGLFPISLVSFAGAVMMIVMGCLTMDEAYQSIDWKAIFLIAGIWPLSTAIQTSGIGEIFASWFLTVAGNFSPVLLVTLLLLLTMLMTNIMAGQAATPIVLAPIGLSIAKATNTDPRMLLLAIALGCSLAFPTPIGHPVNVIVMGSGGYTFKDFLRVGWLLTLLLIPAILLGLHLFWGL
jgi:di/tricarboxylate transporter